jgi:hypothetical protein
MSSPALGAFFCEDIGAASFGADRRSTERLRRYKR